MIDNHVHDEAASSKKRVREQLLKMIDDSKVEQEYSIESEWTDMSPSGEFEAILS
jgi:2-keto-4-pentenoate hydratase